MSTDLHLNYLYSFFKNWEWHISTFPKSNEGAELGVKSGKQVFFDVPAEGSLNNDKAMRAILQYRNAPLPNINLSPAQLLFHPQMRDPSAVLSSPQGMDQISTAGTSQHNCEQAWHLVTLHVGEHVLIYNTNHHSTGQLDREGTIIQM